MEAEDSKRIVGRNGKPLRVERACGQCQTVFLARPGEIARGAGRYCSLECRQRALSLKVAGTSVQHTKPTEDALCGGCGGSFKVYPYRDVDGPRPARYCSRACWRLPPAMKVVRPK